jgi:coproporphyrinogen III oxidase-like Fe-S oxidoreductase
VRPPEQYLQTVEAGVAPVGGEEILDDEESRLESVFLGLRTAAGVPASEIDPDRVAPFLAEGLLYERDGRLVLTERGLFLANDVVLALAGSQTC